MTTVAIGLNVILKVICDTDVGSMCDHKGESVDKLSCSPSGSCDAGAWLVA